MMRGHFGASAGGSTQAILKALEELKSMMQAKMAAGDGEEEMGKDALSQAVSDASASANGDVESSAEDEGESPAMEASEGDAIQEDMKRLMNGPPKKPSRAKMSITAIQVKKPAKKFGKA